MSNTPDGKQDRAAGSYGSTPTTAELEKQILERSLHFKEIDHPEGKTLLSIWMEDIIALIHQEAASLATAVIGEDSLVPKKESWLNGPADKPNSYRNNYEVVRFAEIQNALRAEQRQRLITLTKPEKGKHE